MAAPSLVWGQKKWSEILLAPQSLLSCKLLATVSVYCRPLCSLLLPSSQFGSTLPGAGAEKREHFRPRRFLSPPPPLPPSDRQPGDEQVAFSGRRLALLLNAPRRPDSVRGPKCN